MSAQSAMSANATITLSFPDGATRTFAAGVTGTTVAESIAKSLAKAALAVKLDGVLSDMSLPIEKDCTINFVKREDEEGLDLIRHDCAHVLAEAVQTLFPGTQVTIGPVVENGFYYDFYREKPFTTEDFAAIEKEMRRIVERAAPLTREVWKRADAIAYFASKGETFKVELIEGLPESEDIKVYRQGEWLDLCRGPHLPTVGHVGTAFKLMKVAGAYWRGDSTRQQLTRIYGTAWRNDAELKAHLTQLEEAEKRDHRKIGREMDLFHLQDEAPGSVFWHPKGWTIWLALEGYIRRRMRDAGYLEVKTPQLIDNRLWIESGHWGKYRENMFVVPDEVPSTDEDKPILSGKARLMALKPMNCPAHVQIYNQGVRSYRELPLRLAEFGCCHRNEAHGALHGIMRVRQFVQDDAHIFCRTDQIESESEAFVGLLDAMYKDLGFPEYKVKLATRPAQKHGTDEQWDYAETALANALNTMGMPFTYAPGDGAFYGPKLEFHLTDAIGRTWTCGTLQLDTILPERLDATYIGEDGAKHRPIMLHRAIVGSMERFIGILIESYAGKLPLWLMPTQVVVATITEAANGYAQAVYDQLRAAGVRVELDTRNEKINYKVREHSLAKVPFLWVVGAKEAETNSVAIRTLGSDGQQVVDTASALAKLVEDVKAPY